MISKDIKLRDEHYPDSLKTENTETKMDEVIADAPKHKSSSKYNSKKVREALNRIYGSKCAYCEGSPIGTSSFRIDHYRPHTHIKGIDHKNHLGYYWLYLEWTNLLQSCESCNGSGAKSNKFPLSDPDTRINGDAKTMDVTEHRAINCELLMQEKRLLLHPELDTVEKHFKFHRNGKISSTTDEGNASIDGYDLNRESLIWQRKKKSDHYFDKLIGILNDFEDYGANEHAELMLRRDLFNYFIELLLEQGETETYSSMGYYMFEHFEKFYLNQLPDEINELREMVRKHYKTIYNRINN